MVNYMISLVRYIRCFVLLVALSVLSAVVSFAQSEKIFTISEFVQDPFDLSGRGDTTKMVDGSGYLYSIVKVSSDDPEDKLSDYRFDFGMLKSIVKVVDGELWVYVQKNAKQVSVSRQGYKTVHRFDLGYTLESGAVYRMKISVKREAVGKAMLQFKITPAKSGIAIMYTNASGKEGLFGITDDSGSAVKYLELGTYTYKVVADMYHPSEGYISLKTRNEVFVEDVVLRANYAEVELVTSSGVDIFIDGQSVGKSSWSGALNPGNYTVECRLANHKTTTRIIEVKDGEKYKFQLDSPVPIVGTLILASTPLGAAVQIDGKYLGVTPLVLDNLLIGAHTIEISHSNYTTKTKTVVVKEGEGLEENIVLEKVASQSNNAIVGGGSQANSSGNGPEYVDLGLPSGLKWATCNLGASSPEELGDYFAWGETSKKSDYRQSNCLTFGKSISDFSGDLKYDAARKILGSGWRIPTKSDFQELIDMCKWKWVSVNGVNGYKVTGPNGNSIFLPAAGSRDGTTFYRKYSDGYYRSSTPKGTESSYTLNFSSGNKQFYTGWRYYGHSVRAVYEGGAKSQSDTEINDMVDRALATVNNKPSSSASGSKSRTINGHEYVDLGLPSGLKWATCNVGASSSEGNGNYYAWGEIEIKSEYYDSKTDGKSMQDISGNSTYDVARAKWGGSWRLPTKEEFSELRQKCKWQWTTQNGKKGYKVTGPNGNSIFLPAAGCYNGRFGLISVGQWGYYWSSTPYNHNNGTEAYSLTIATSSLNLFYSNRYLGLSVRPVSK
ncbi:MAG: PEGA domain-containing protein [Bacteroidales bacterium]|nr:PEGA domain-containing protein [Bacteroidales bacterium]